MAQPGRAFLRISRRHSLRRAGHTDLQRKVFRTSGDPQTCVLDPGDQVVEYAVARITQSRGRADFS